ncbi:MAG: Nif3-like dinuclear metal center hexameric protein [Chitinophagaceae bacterium]|nr:Nif3-like dinuclear metal center hexameric protein [Chitinophagaceae bacterium]
MQISEILSSLETFAPLAYQENYDNAGLIVGNPLWECTGVICTLDSTEAVILEAKAAGCNLVIAHHPIVFKGLKKITGKTYVEKTIITAIKNDIAVYAIHTNLDNIFEGVNQVIAQKLGLIHRNILQSKADQLAKLYSYVPSSDLESVKNALFAAGAGQIGNYSECSFQTVGIGNFKGNANSNPTIGIPEKKTELEELKIEVVFPVHLKNKLVHALLVAHPYEEPAYEILTLSNDNQYIGSGLRGELAEPVEERAFLRQVQNLFGLKLIRHSPLLGKPIQKVAVCGGAGSFLLPEAIASGADLFITSDLKYHEFFDADNRILIADIGHWESEQFTTDLLIDILQAKFPTFAVLKSVIKTNPVNYFL